MNIFIIIFLLLMYVSLFKMMYDCIVETRILDKKYKESKYRGFKELSNDFYLIFYTCILILLAVTYIGLRLIISN